MNILCTGALDEGKTTLALWLARQRHECVFVFDPKSNIQGHVCYTADDLEEAVEQEKWREGFIVFRYDMAERESKDAFAEMAGCLWQYGGYALVVDESAELQSWASIDPLLKKTVAQHCKRPPERSVTVIQTNHRLPEYNGKVKTVMAELYQFRTNNPRDLEILVDYCGDDVIASLARELPKHHVLRIKLARQEGGAPQWELWNDPARWYVPLEFEQSIPPAPRERSFMERVNRESIRRRNVEQRTNI